MFWRKKASAATRDSLNTDLEALVDRAVFRVREGVHIMIRLRHCLLKQAHTREFKEHSRKVVAIYKEVTERLKTCGYKFTIDGIDNYLVL